MCGIAGVFFSRSGRSVESSLVTRMTDLIVHRGPDDAGQLVDRDLGIGMRRLSIIDLSAGHQPVFNEDQSIAVVFNGEIYNFQEIRDELVAKGHQFRTHSDTEVIVHLYEEMGADFPRRLNGMFAIALWDSKRRRLVVVRDRLGVKPVYYAWTADGLVFGSELKCVLADRGVSREIDQEALYQYLTLGYIPNPMSIHRDVRQLPPGARIVVEGGEMRIDRYWRLNAMVDRSLSRPDAEHKLRDLLSNATKLRMISDVPLGAFLSGGLDSSIVVALMAKQSSVPVKTFYIDFDEPEYSEREFARAVAQRYGTDHHELVVRPSAVDILDRLVAHYDEPFADSSAIPTWFVSQLTREHVTVALAGDGGDESFGGYTRYQRILAHREFPSAIRKLAGGVGNALAAVLPRTMTGRDAMRALGYDYGQLFAGVFDEAKTRELLTPEFLRTAGKSSVWDAASEIYRRADPDDRLARYALLDLERYLPDDILAKVDRASMAH
ncbi:MAG: asparagine synthase (glutamine-hydrolyzing), partial [Planctomycetota bacterium]|nr:asparagine synthase (glutamine-hydrolyzing) [Planctomycetota bacterium]